MIELTPSEVALAAQIGSRRFIESKFSDRKEKIGASDGWNNNIEGALAEVAFAKDMNLWFDPNLGKFGEPDVDDWHVRSTKHEHGHLCIHPKENSGKFVLLVGQFNQWEVKGWIAAEHARQEKYFRTMRSDRPVACYWIPQNKLKIIEKIR